VSSGGASYPVLDASDLDRVTGHLQAHQFFWLDVLRARVRREPVRHGQALVFEIVNTVLSSYAPVLDRVDDTASMRSSGREELLRLRSGYAG
jgi:hypothetical protein